DNWDGSSCSLGSEGRSVTARHDHGNRPCDEISRQPRQSVISTLRPAVFDRNVLAFNKASLIEALTEGCQQGSRIAGGGIPEKSNRRKPLLRARNHRPRRCAAEPRDELAPVHSMTSFALRRIGVGSSMPMAFAVLRFTAKSNRLGCSIGMSPT